MSAPREARPVVVGVDGSRGSAAALRFALEEARARQVGVQIVTTWLLGPPMREAITERMYAEESAAARTMQTEMIAAATEDMTDPPPTTHLVVHDVGGSTLVEAAENGCMLVVGSGRKGALARTFLGSVSEFCVRHATVPVVVVPDPARIEAVTAESVPASVSAD